MVSNILVGSSLYLDPNSFEIILSPYPRNRRI